MTKKVINTISKLFLVPSSLYEQHYFGDSDAHFPVFAECSDLKNKEAQKNKNSSSQRTKVKY